MSVTSGPTSSKQFAWFDRGECCWKTWPAISLLGSDEFSQTWPRSGTTVGGRAYELPTWAPPTGASASSSSAPTLLPTPGEKGGPNQRGSSGDLMLPSAVMLLPTPTVGDAAMARNSTATRHKIPPTGIHKGDTLTDILVLRED